MKRIRAVLLRVVESMGQVDVTDLLGGYYAATGAPTAADRQFREYCDNGVRAVEAHLADVERRNHD